jgi:hypothetical protein
MIEITEKIAAKVLTIVDAGLTSGLGKPKPGEMCIEAAVCYALGEPHGDEPACVSKALRAFKIRLNDSDWSNRHARAMGLRRLALAQLGSAGSLDEVLFVTRLAILAKKWAYDAARATAAARATYTARAATADDAARATADAAAYAATYAAGTAYAADDAADYAADYAARATYTADAADYAADAATHATYATRAATYATAADDAARATADAATYAASAAAYVARAAAYVARGDAATTDAAADAIARTVRNESLANAAEDVVQLLIEMNAPGTKWLALAPLNS